MKKNKYHSDLKEKNENKARLGNDEEKYIAMYLRCLCIANVSLHQYFFTSLK